ncbi:general stress protein [Priestia filamentosa]|uniref:general stress protein n=1 Tax=Priestia filamentosa TaxID=1402861 RepID=UPI0039825601
MKYRMEKRLSYLFTGETASIIMFPIISAVWFWSYPEMKMYTLLSFWFSFFLLEFLLLQGSLYWRYKLKLLRKEDISVTPAQVIHRLKVMKKVNGGLFLISPLIFAIDFFIWSPKWLFQEVWYGVVVFIFLFALLEYINYFFVQLSYDNISDLRTLIKARKLKQACMRKDMERQV